VCTAGEFGNNAAVDTVNVLGEYYETSQLRTTWLAYEHCGGGLIT
jgi:hypothetical protein